LSIVYYDDRNTAADSTEVMLARTSDGGATWKERDICDHRFQPKPILGGSSTYQGDHIALTAADNKLHAFWMDDYSGIYQVWFAVLDQSLLAVKDRRNGRPERFSLAQNYPNPFNASTKIEYSLPSGYDAMITVYNILGQKIADFYDPVSDDTRHSIEWNAFNAASGVYFYRLNAVNIIDPANRYSEIRSMLLIK
jgi:hypothetical protein